ncbi:MAG: dipicolinate synthase subunit DpsA [Ruminococcaceae bacterium]|nr:dipicolinate synthase subunit DpsA [Oscillospiraceae bacterium]
MIQDLKIGIIGSDVRQSIVARELASAGATVYGYAVTEEEGINICSSVKKCTSLSDIIILALPYSADSRYINCPDSEIKITDFFNSIAEGKLVLAGKTDEYARRLCNERNIKLTDYFEYEELTLLNAVPTCEGALELAMRELDITIFDSKSLVLGYGRIGKILANHLAMLGSDVTVSARKSRDRTLAVINGHNSCDISEIQKRISQFDVVFNTIPSLIFNRELLEKTPNNTLIIDLASRPGGVDMNTAKAMGKRVIWALSLPGKVAPVSAGKIIFSTIMKILEEEGFL